MLDESRTSANLGNNHTFIIKKYYLPLVGVLLDNLKSNYESSCSKWTISYHCEEPCSSNMISESCSKLEKIIAF